MPQSPPEEKRGSDGKVRQVEHAVEEFISGAHEKEDRARGVVDAKNGVGREVHGLVTLRACYGGGGERREIMVQNSLFGYTVVPVSNDSLSHELRSERASKPTNDLSGAREQNDQGGATE